MAHTFTVRLTDEIASVLKRVESEIADSGGTFLGNTKEGSFEGNTVIGEIKGEYCTVTDNEISITIKNKPFLIPYSTIESVIRKYFG